jgi:hypothetical protein
MPRSSFKKPGLASLGLLIELDHGRLAAGATPANLIRLESRIRQICLIFAAGADVAYPYDETVRSKALEASCSS